MSPGIRTESCTKVLTVYKKEINRNLAHVTIEKQSSGKRCSLSPREPGEFGHFSASRHLMIIGFSKCGKEITSLMSSMNFIFELALYDVMNSI